MLNIIKNKLHIKQIIIGTIGAALALLGVILVFSIANNQQNRELFNWQVQLDRIADSKSAEVSRWLKNQFQNMEALSENTSLRLYMTDISKYSARKVAQEQPFQAVYLRNLLVVSSQKTGFDYDPIESTVKANVEFDGIAGIALLNKERKLVVSTSYMPELRGYLKEFIEKLVPAESAVSDIYVGGSGKLSIAFAVPVFAVQGEKNPDGQIGTIIGVRTVNDSLFEILQNYHTSEETMETLLVRKNEQKNLLQYLSNLKDNSSPLSKNIDLDNDNIASVYAAKMPGKFSIKRDYAYHKVLVTGRKIDGAPWMLVQKIDRDEAMIDSDNRRSNIIYLGLAIILLMVFLLLFIWRHSTTIKAQKTADQYMRLANKYEAKKEWLEVIADNKPEALFIFDEKNKCLFANLEASKQLDIEPADMLGKSLALLTGKERAAIYTKMNATALLEEKIVSFVQTQNNNNKIIQSQHIPLQRIPRHQGRGVLVIEQDITAPMQQQQKLLNIKNSMIEMLIAIMDKRDSHTANHSQEVAKLARKIGEEMKLESETLETVYLAGLIMNIGKIFVPLDILNKKTKLTAKESKNVNDHLLSGADLLSNIEFEGPVLDTIKQVHNQNSKKSKSLLSAVIVRIANNFVAMLSPRSYRDRLNIDDAMEQLRKSAKTTQEKSVFAALANYLENKGGRSYWEKKAK